ncbi:hypothetical protein BDA99DRAFT_504910 [Phascolomyces articulosus]|uniref:F-box domain-containing protein n=1 Tax=Phascolomyces articulosus TaxID=60185 RepID=A0AAD5KDP9_9FUNG|nr:hypothetical protein BDA99DRAFT_504910 [Phascolomyces articulosus]
MNTTFYNILPLPTRKWEENNDTAPCINKSIHLLTDTTKDCHWSDILNATRTAFSNGHFDKVIDQSSLLLYELQTQTVLALTMRAHDWAQKRYYDRELEDAQTMISIAPHHPTGYLLTAHRYASQGLYHNVVELYTKAMDMVPMTHPNYEIILQGKLHAQQKLNYQVDFIANLPYDLVCLVIDYIPQETLAQCTIVSRTWRQKILEYSKCWRTFSIERFQQITPHPLNILPTVSHFIQALSVPHAKPVKYLLKLMAHNKFKNLHSFSITSRGPLVTTKQVNLFYIEKDS